MSHMRVTFNSKQENAWDMLQLSNLAGATTKFGLLHLHIK